MTNGPLLRGVRYTPGGAVTDSIVMRSRSGTVRRISAQQSLEKLSALTGFEVPLVTGIVGDAVRGARIGPARSSTFAVSRSISGA